MSVVNLAQPNHNQNNKYRYTNTNNIPKFQFSGQNRSNVEKMQKLKGPITLSKIRQLKLQYHSHAHFQIMMKHSAKFQVNRKRCDRSCGDKIRVSKDRNSIKNGRIKNLKPYAHLHILRMQAI